MCCKFMNVSCVRCHVKSHQILCSKVRNVPASPDPTYNLDDHEAS